MSGVRYWSKKLARLFLRSVGGRDVFALLPERLEAAHRQLVRQQRQQQRQQHRRQPARHDLCSVMPPYV